MVSLKELKTFRDSGLPIFPINIWWNEDKKKFEKKPLVSWEELRHRLPTDEELESWLTLKPNGWGFPTGEFSNVDVLDLDLYKLDDIKDDNYQKLLELSSTVEVETISGGKHLYFKHHPKNYKNQASINGLPVDTRADGGYIAFLGKVDDAQYRFVKKGNFSELPDFPEWLLPSDNNHEEAAKRRAEIARGVPDGQRHTTAPEYVGSLLARYPEDEWETFVWPTFQNWNVAPNNDLPLGEKELRKIYEDIASKELAKPKKDGEPEGNIDWPTPLAPEAFHGVLGELVKVISPHTEASEEALLVNFLCAFGNVIGDKAFFQIEADKHPTRIFVVLVGATGGGGRKGTATSYVRRIFKEIDPEWVKRIQTGLSSGEGLIWSVRDQITKEKKKGDEILEEIVDEGVSDKRLLVVEGEFAQTLRVMAREGNTLSAVLRNAWDFGDLQVLTKNSPAKATGAHISVLANVTPEELHRYLTETESSNGFANRFIFCLTKRSKFLPRGSKLDETELAAVISKLTDAVYFGKNSEEITRSEETWQIWEEVYPKLSDGRTGLIGALTSRADAIVTRISNIYALADQKNIVEPEHLLAALAVWQYIEDSTRYIFQKRTGDWIANRIYKYVLEKGKATRTDIRDLFDKHQSREKIDTALEVLLTNNLLSKETIATKGRSVEVWSRG